MPATAAMPAATAKAYSFTPTTLMPSDAAARSLVRTAMSRRPVRERRRLATTRPSATNAPRHTSAHRCGWLKASTSTPNSSMRPIGVPPSRLPPTYWLLANTTSDTVKPRPSVTTARLTPRVRSAGRANTMPMSTVSTTPAGMASSAGTSARISWPAISAPMPPSAHWASDSCPAYPVSTTIDRIITPAASEM